MRFVSDRLIMVLGVAATIVISSFLLALVVPPLFFHLLISPAYLFEIRLILFVMALLTVCGLAPFLIYQFRQKTKLQEAINHFVKNKMQEIVIAIDLIEANLVKTSGTELTYEEKIELLQDVRATCLDVAGNLAQRILAEAPKFNSRVASESQTIIQGKTHSS